MFEIFFDSPIELQTLGPINLILNIFEARRYLLLTAVKKSLYFLGEFLSIKSPFLMVYLVVKCACL